MCKLFCQIARLLTFASLILLIVLFQLTKPTHSAEKETTKAHKFLRTSPLVWLGVFLCFRLQYTEIFFFFFAYDIFQYKKDMAFLVKLY